MKMPVRAQARAKLIDSSLHLDDPSRLKARGRVRFHLVTLGCPKNRVDSEVMFGSLLKNQFEYTNQPEEAELIVINSCSFIEEAKKESIDTILEMSQYKKRGRLQKLVVAGCLAQRYQGQIETLLPEVDYFIGTGEYYKIAAIIESEKRGHYSIPSYIHTYEAPRINSMPAYTAYLKLTEGCNRKCAFCIIPKIRGKQRSQSIQNLLTEAQILSENGATELNLIGQDLTAYGTDLRDHTTSLETLLKGLVKIKKLNWIRLLYCYPDHITDEFISLLKNEAHICSYIDMPLQHIDDDILKSMRRGVNSRMIRKIIERLRTEIPDLIFRTSFIVGYPDETEKQFQTLYEFVKEMRFDRVGIFGYSPEEDTHAATLPRQIPKKIKTQRRDALMMLQAGISLKHHQALKGKKIDVLIEGWDKQKRLYQGRHAGQAPEIDGYSFIQAPPTKKLLPGSYVTATVQEASPYDLVCAI